MMVRDFEKEIGECEKTIEKYGTGSPEGIKAQMRISEIRQTLVDYRLEDKRAELERELSGLKFENQRKARLTGHRDLISENDYDYYVKEGKKQKSGIEKMRNDPDDNGGYGFYNAMGDDEYNNAMYMYGKYGSKIAEKYIDDIGPDVRQRLIAKEKQSDEDFAEKAPAAALIYRALLKPVASLGSLMGTTGAALKNAFSDEYIPPDMTGGFFDPIRTTNTIHDKLVEGKSGLGRFLLETGMGITDVLVSLPFGKAGSLAVMGTNAAGDTAFDALQRGATPGQALALGVTNGLIEVATEKIGIDRLFSLVGKPANSIAKSIIKQAGIEGLEEFVSEYASYLSDNSIIGENSSYSRYIRQLMEEGMSRSEAVKKANMQYLVVNPIVSFAGGALSGLVLGGGGSAINSFITVPTERGEFLNNLGSQMPVLAADNTNNHTAAADPAKLMPGNTNGNDTNGKKPVADEGAIFLKFAERGETNKLKASVLAKLIKSFLDGKQMSRQQWSVIANDANAMDILKEYMTKDSERANRRPVGRSPIESLNSYTGVALPETIGFKGAAAYNRIHKDFRVSAAREPRFNAEFTAMYNAGLRGLPFETVKGLSNMHSLLKELIYTSGKADAEDFAANKADNTLTDKGDSGNIDDEEIAVIKQGQQGLEMKWYPNKEELIIPIDWLLGLFLEAKKRMGNE